jgi:Gpi18-like mannosyltransferase
VSAVAEAPIATRLPGWGPAIRVGLSIWLLSRVVFLVGGFLITLIFGSARGKDAGLPVAVWPFRLYSNFDAGHFLRVAHYGYYPPPGRQLQVVSAPFLPGYPFTGRWVAQLLGFGTLTPAGLYTGLALVAWAGSAAAAVLIWRLAAEQADERTATWAAAILLLGPYSPFLMASYSEGPFLALALGAWLAARHDRWWLAGILAAGAALVRVNAIFLVAGLIVMYVLARRGRRVDAGGLLLAPLASFGYIAWLHSRTGSWTTWFLAQRIGWKRTTVTPWTALYNSVHRAVLDHDPAVRFQAWMELLFAVLMLATVVLLARRRLWPEFTYVGLTAASLLSSTYYLSVPRSMLLCFPAVILLAHQPSSVAWRRLWWTGGVAGAALLVVNTTTFLTNNWTG